MWRDFLTVGVIGVAIGIFAQPVITNLIPQTTPILRGGVVLGAGIFALFALWIASLLNKIIKGAYQFAKFGAVGTLNSFIDFAVLNLAIALTGIAGGWGYSFFKGISFLCATTNSFFWNRWWTFGERHTTSAQTIKFYVIAGVGWAINITVASFVVNGIRVPAGVVPNLWANIGALAGVGASFLFNFIGYKLWVFKKPIAISMLQPEEGSLK